MTTYAPFDRDQPFLLPPDLKEWLPEDDLAHFIVAAAERVRLGAFRTNRQAGGKPQYHPRLMLALLVYCYTNGVFSSRRIERATYREIGARFVAANTHPDHDTIATFRRTNKAAFEAAFLELLLLARASGLLRLGTVLIDGTKIDADASKIRSVRYDRAQALRAKLAADMGLSGISCGVGHDGSKGARSCRDAKNLISLMPCLISCWPAPIRERRLSPMGCLRI